MAVKGRRPEAKPSTSIWSPGHGRCKALKQRVNAPAPLLNPLRHSPRAATVSKVAPNYWVNADSGIVETWSTRRLRFDAKGWEREWRAELKAALRSIDSSSGFLAARYGSPMSDFRCDAENILFCKQGR